MSPSVAPPHESDRHLLALMRELLDREDSGLTLLWESPEAAIECTGRWTDFQTRRFAGPTIQDALEAACAQKRGVSN